MRLRKTLNILYNLAVSRVNMSITPVCYNYFGVSLCLLQLQEWTSCRVQLCGSSEF